jgi:hypothetical protein
MDLGSSAFCSVDVEASIDACVEPFTFRGVGYEDIVDYCTRLLGVGGWGGCTAVGWSETDERGGVGGGLEKLFFVRRQDTPGLVTAFETKADEVLGPDDYFVEVIGFMPEFACDLAAGQSHATNLATLASSSADVFPLCESYAPALGRIQNYATALLQTTYTLELGPRETLEGVYVTDLAGTERELDAADYSYDFDQSLLTLKAEAITGLDRSLRIELEIHCVPVAR